MFTLIIQVIVFTCAIMLFSRIVKDSVEFGRELFQNRKEARNEN